MAMQTKLLDSNSTLAIMDPARAHRASSVARYSSNYIRIKERIISKTLNYIKRE